MIEATAPVLTLSAHGIAVGLFTLLIFGLFVWDRFPIASVCLLVLVALPIGLTVFPLVVNGEAVNASRFFAGFAHPALIAICALMVVGQALVLTGALEPLARKLSALIGSRPGVALLALLLGSASVSGIINDTPVVVLLIPLIIAASAQAKRSAATMLLPMNYAVLIGGMSTTIGTSTNLIVIALAAQMGVGPFGIFDFYTLVAIAAIPAFAYLWLIAPRLLTGVRSVSEPLVESVFEAELHVEAGSWLDGRELQAVFQATGNRLQVIAVKRQHHALIKLPNLRLRAQDHLLIQGTAAQLKEFEGALKARLYEPELLDEKAFEQSAKPGPQDAPKADATIPNAVLAQMIITADSPLVGRSVRDGRLAQYYSVIVVGIQSREGEARWQRQRMASRTLVTGDILLLQGEASAMQEAQRAGIGLLLDASFTLPRQHKATIALLTMAAVVILAASKTLPIAIAALAGVFCLLLTRCVSWTDVSHSLSAKVVLLVAASLALGDALELTGVTAYMASIVADMSRHLSPGGVLFVLIGMIGLLTNFVSNNAAAAIGTPLGIELARQLGVPPEPFVLAVLFGCNLCYLTPMGYQTNLLVMNAGGYRFSDFVKVGTPLFLIMWLGLSYGLILRYGL